MLNAVNPSGLVGFVVLELGVDGDDALCFVGPPYCSDSNVKSHRLQENGMKLSARFIFSPAMH